ncbi:MAG TPA: hypothetical protein VNH11_08055 [Pirellulales bacterium]|nr:hypothetical protein [Pirellulales bacterium]
MDFCRLPDGFRGVAYAWWAKLKPLFLREDLFIIRNRLWDVALQGNAFSDPAYKQARAHLNALIRTAALFSLPSIKAAAKATAGRSCPSVRLKANDAALQAAIDAAYQESAEAVVKYVMYRSAFGLLVVCDILFTIVVRRSIIEGLSTLRTIQKWIKSVGPDELSQMEATARHGKVA